MEFNPVPVSFAYNAPHAMGIQAEIDGLTFMVYPREKNAERWLAFTVSTCCEITPHLLENRLVCRVCRREYRWETKVSFDAFLTTSPLRNMGGITLPAHRNLNLSGELQEFFEKIVALSSLDRGPILNVVIASQLVELFDAYVANNYEPMNITWGPELSNE